MVWSPPNPVGSFKTCALFSSRPLSPEQLSASKEDNVAPPSLSTKLEGGFRPQPMQANRQQAAKEKRNFTKSPHWSCVRVQDVVSTVRHCSRIKAFERQFYYKRQTFQGLALSQVEPDVLSGPVRWVNRDIRHDFTQPQGIKVFDCAVTLRLGASGLNTFRFAR